MSWEDDAVRRMNAESGGGSPDRRGHFVKMGAALAVTAICFGLFALGVLGGRKAALQGGPPVKDKVEAAKRLAAVSGLEMGALLLGGASGVYLVFLLLRLRRFE